MCLSYISGGESVLSDFRDLWKLKKSRQNRAGRSFTESHFEGEAWESRMYNGIAGCRILIFCQSLKPEDLNPVGPPVKLSENP